MARLVATDSYYNELEVILNGHGREWLADLRLPFDAHCCFLAYSDELIPSPNELRACLSPAESVHYEGLHSTSSAGRASEWLLGRFCSKAAVRRLFEVEGSQAPAWQSISILPDAFGKPMVTIAGGDDVDLVVSLAHTRTGVLSLAARRQESVGVDLESTERAPSNCRGFARHVLSETEMAQMDFAADCGEQLLRYWVAKEAAAKAIGTGFQGQPKQFELGRLPTEEGSWVRHGGSVIPVHLKWRDGFLLAIAYVAKDPD